MTWHIVNEVLQWVAIVFFATRTGLSRLNFDDLKWKVDAMQDTLIDLSKKDSDYEEGN